MTGDEAMGEDAYNAVRDLIGAVVFAAWALCDNTANGGTEQQRIRPVDWNRLADAIGALEKAMPRKPAGDYFWVGVGAAVGYFWPRLLDGNAAADVLKERWRQRTIEGWSDDHDDRHTDGSLALAAALYASPRDDLTVVRVEPDGMRFENPWPWVSEGKPGFGNAAEWDKRQKHDRRRRLVIAGALILAEIERLDRRAAREAAETSAPAGGEPLFPAPCLDPDAGLEAQLAHSLQSLMCDP